jgi:ferric-dicitrate binding protein FerR (iron transport regulator)
MHTDDLLIKYLLGEADPVERARTQQMLAADERKKERLRQLTVIRDLSDRVVPPAPDWQEAYERFRLRLQRPYLVHPTDRQHQQERRPVRSAAFRLSGIWPIAAFLTGIFFLAALLFVYRKQESKTVLRLAAPAAITVSRPGPVELPDGSVVKLESNTTMSYAFGKQTVDRTVYLKGQAFFSVAADASKPFIIHVSDLTIKVLGTSFGVREAGGSTVIEMSTGAVEVSKGRVRRVIRAGDTLKTNRDSDTLLVSGIRVDAALKSHKTSTMRRAEVPLIGSPAPPPDTTRRPVDRLATVRSIVADLVQEKIVSKKDDIDWFGLDNGQFVVNDRQMPDSLLRKFSSKYIRPDGLGYYYGSVKVHGRGYFFTKNELNDH